MTPREQVSLADYTTLAVGGPARFFFDAQDRAALTEALAWARERKLPIEVLGGGSNVLIADRGLDALVLRIRDATLNVEDENVTVGAGMRWDDLVAWSVAEDRAGLECLSGIPGDVGAAPMQNVGAYGQEVSETITRVDVIERATGNALSLLPDACAFGYRDSVFKRSAEGRYVVARVCFRLCSKGAPTVRYPELQRAVSPSPTLSEVRSAVLALRRGKSMVIDPNDDNRRSVGSFFLNPVVAEADADRMASPRYPAAGGVKLSAAWLIEHAGLTKGTTRGPVGLSTRHSLAIINRGGATSTQLIAFAAEVRERVRDRFGVSLVPEPRFLGFEPHELRALFD
jgi:UDP-N-acetylmuramate dehydrogenase